MPVANYRNICMTFWTDSKVVDEFSPEDRYIYLYCLTNPHTNLCGCYEISLRQISAETGYTADAALKVIQRLDTAHNVIRYDAGTKELLLLNWYRYNWSGSDKLNKPLLDEIKTVKSDGFRRYLAGLYNSRANVPVPYDAGQRQKTDAPADLPEQPKKKAPPKKKYGQYGWVRLTDDQHDSLEKKLGTAELERCIAYIDESAQATGNKNGWKDWNLVIQRCSREHWGHGPRAAQVQPKNVTAASDLVALYEGFGGESG